MQKLQLTTWESTAAVVNVEDIHVETCDNYDTVEVDAASYNDDDNSVELLKNEDTAAGNGSQRMKIYNDGSRIHSMSDAKAKATLGIL